MGSWAGWEASCHRRCSPQNCCGSKRWEVSKVSAGPPIHQTSALFVQGSACTGFDLVRLCSPCVCTPVAPIDGLLLNTFLSIFLLCGWILSESQGKLLEQSSSLFRPSRLPVLESNCLFDTVSCEVMYDAHCVLCKLPRKCFSHQGRPHKQQLRLWNLEVDVLFS